MNDICIVIPYFGKLPTWMPLFINSCIENPTIDFLIITDDNDFETPQVENIRVLRRTFHQMQQLLKTKLGNKVRLPRPYKLCDYKPCYGVLFGEYLHGYAYWGHCDLDTILGDIRGFVERIRYKQYERLFTHGHFVIYKNEQTVNTLFSRPLPSSLPPIMHWDYVTRTSHCCHFDEVGMNLICSYYGISFCKTEVAFDVSCLYYDFRRSCTPSDVKCLITFERGHIFGYEYDGQTLSRKEYMYVHFMKRKIEYYNNLTSRFIISHRGFLPLEGDVTPELIHRVVPHSASISQGPITISKRNTIRKIWDVFKLDFPVRGCMALHTIYAIWKSVRWINQEGGDDLYEKSKWFNGTITAPQLNNCSTNETVPE